MFLVIGLMAVAGIVGYTVVKKTQAQGAAYQPTAPGVSQGTVRFGPQPTTLAQLQGGNGGPSSSSLVGFSAGAASSGVGAAAGLGLISATGNLAKAVPIIGSVIGIGLGVYNMIAQHHAAALAAEGKALNDATPRAMQTFVLIVQATMSGEITTFADAQSLVQQTIDLWYGEVKPVQKGLWPYRGYRAIRSFIGSPFAVTFAQHPEQVPPDPFDDKAGPNPCNGACSLGHFFLERRGAVILQVVNDILLGLHGVMVLSAVPPHETQQGYPAISVAY